MEGATARLPALTESARLRFATLAVLYAAQGVPFGLMVVALPAYLAERGVGGGHIGGLVALAMLPWSLKLVAGPIMDRWSFLAMGRRRPWVLFAQAGIVLGFLAMSLISDPVANLALVGAAAFAVNCFAAFQDVAVDGMAIDVLPMDEHARANGFMWGGQILGIAGTTVGGAWLLDAYGLRAAALAATVVVLAIMCVPLLLRERPGERLAPWSAGRASERAASLQLTGWRDIVSSLFRAVILPASLIAAIAQFTYRIGVGLMSAVLPVMTVQELGWEDTGFAELNGSARLLTGVLCMLVGGWLVERTGRLRMMAIAGTLNVILAAAMGLFPGMWSHDAVVPGYIVVQLGLDALQTVAFFAIAMGLCGKRIAATQYAIYMALGNLGFSVGAGAFGPLRENLGGYPALFLVFAACTAVMVACLRFVDLQAHVSRLERLDAAPAPVN